MVIGPNLNNMLKKRTLFKTLYYINKQYMYIPTRHIYTTQTHMYTV